MKNPTRQTRRNGSAVAAAHQSPNREITLTLSPALSGVLDDYAGSWGIKIEELCEWLVFSMAQAGSEESANPLTASALLSKGARSKERRMNLPIKSINQAGTFIDAIDGSHRGAPPAASPAAPLLTPPAAKVFGGIDDLSRSIRDAGAVMDLGERYLDDHDEIQIPEEMAAEMASSFRSLKCQAREKMAKDLAALWSAWRELNSSVPGLKETNPASNGGVA